MPKETGSKPSGGDSKIVRQGHTASNSHGSNPDIKGKLASPARDLKIK